MLEGLFRKSTNKDIFLVLLSAAAIVAFWRGIWNLLDSYFYPNNFVLSQILSILGGVMILLLLSQLKKK